MGFPIGRLRQWAHRRRDTGIIDAEETGQARDTAEERAPCRSDEDISAAR
jgi:hypothetical protein